MAFFDAFITYTRVRDVKREQAIFVGDQRTQRAAFHIISDFFFLKRDSRIEVMQRS